MTIDELIASWPELQAFVEARIRSGQFRSPQEALETILSNGLLMMTDGPGSDLGLDPEFNKSLNEGFAEIERGEGIPWEQVKAELARKHPGLIRTEVAADVGATR